MESALQRFEQLLRERFPDLLAGMRPGLDDAGVERLRAALRPLHLPAEVETLYRWRDGGDAGIFGGWRLRPLDDLLAWRVSCLAEMGEPPAWLQLFDDQILGFTALGVGALEPADPSVWYGHTHDQWVDRLVDSIEDLVEVCCDAITAGAVTEEHGGLTTARELFDGTIAHESFDGPAWTAWRLARCPGSYRHPDPPAGTSLSRFEDERWPADWVRSFDVGCG